MENTMLFHTIQNKLLGLADVAGNAGSAWIAGDSNKLLECLDELSEDLRTVIQQVDEAYVCARSLSEIENNSA
jgi:hypothetical protein